MSFHDPKRDAWHRSLGESAAPVAHDPATLLAIDQALHRARELKLSGHLIKPIEAMAVACKDGHSTETLYSIARTAAFATNGDLDTVLRRLEHEWPDYA